MTTEHIVLSQEFADSASGRILERQSTFLRFALKNSVEYKINYIEKLEYSIEKLDFIGISVVAEHPLLKHYQQDKVDIYISSKTENALTLIAEFESMVKIEYFGWRKIEDYFNTEWSLKSILEGGYGLIYTGPNLLAKKIELVLQKNEIKYKVAPRNTKQENDVKALLIGANVVIAKDFIVEKIES